MSTQWDQECCLSYLLLCLQCLVPVNIFGMNNEWMNKWMSEPMLCGGCINSIERSKAEGRWMSPAAIVVTGGCDSCTTSTLQLKPILHVWGGWGEWLLSRSLVAYIAWHSPVYPFPFLFPCLDLCLSTSVSKNYNLSLPSTHFLTKAGPVLIGDNNYHTTFSRG